ncbi:MAG: ion transporter, partial [Deltaproteobacteria bacterium]
MSRIGSPAPRAPWREALRRIIFEAETPEGKAFDVALLWVILASIVAVMLESVASVRSVYGPALRAAEWGFTVLFSIEYGLRLACATRAGAYARSFFGIVDLLAILPTYLSLLLPGSQSLIVIRGIRLLRIFRVLKLGRFLGEMSLLTAALRNSRHKIVVFLGTVLILLLILGSAMYLIEGAESGFTSIPTGVYWAIVTMTTVGYGDIAPQTVMGKLLASAVMILGFSIIAVPSGIVTAEIVESVTRKPVTTRVCPDCMSEG